MTRLAYYHSQIRQLLILWASIVILFSAERALMFRHFVPDSIRSQPNLETAALFTKGLLFDIKVACITVALPFLLGLLSLLHPAASRLWQRFQAALLAVLFAIVAAAAIGNWFYFSVYGHQFDVFMFGLFDEDTRAVVKTMWADYPVIRGLIGLIVAIALFAWLLNRSTRRIHPQSHARKSTWFAIILLPIIALTIGIRGSFGKFPLRQSAVYISAVQQINKLVPNALTSISWAWNDYRNSNHFAPVSEAEGAKIISQLIGKTTNADLNQFLHTTPKNPAVEQHQPNVVFAVMESMSAHLLAFDSPERNLLGSLKTHWQQDWVYHKFVSEGDGTSDTLHRFFIRSPRNNVSQSLAKNKPFPTNLFTPYKQAGYRIVYITAGNGGWRDFDNFIRHLGADEIIDENTIKTRYPQAVSATWGIPDEYMFRYAADELKRAEQDGKPVFIMLLSITNHPPYQLPAPHQRQNFHLTAQEQSRLSSLAQGDTLNEVFNTYKYSNDQLGNFISQVKQNSPHTIIAATGDHNMRAISYPDPQDTALGHGVPFYLYVPPEYRTQAQYQPQRAGSHKDIVPTLYALSLSQAQYYQTGCNLTAPSEDAANPFCGYGYNPEVILTNNGFYNTKNQQYRTWQNGDTLTANAQPSTPSSADQQIIQQAIANSPFLEWQLNRIVAGTK
ncbi:LTA synthase family protein [Kingella oralis]